MASRRPPLSKGADLPHDVSMSISPLKSPKSVGKNHAVICLVFFNILASNAREITGHLWRHIRSSNRGDVLKGLMKISLPLALLIVIPLVILQEIPSQNIFLHLDIVWTALLHFSVWPVAIAATALVVHHVVKNQGNSSETSVSRRPLIRNGFYFILGLAACLVAHCHVQIIYPSWIWNPFLWGRYPIYLPSDLAPALEGVCVDDSESKRPLCLTEKSWKTLSAGALSSKNKKDVAAVKEGLKVAQDNNGGLVINVMSRDTVDAIPALQENVEALLPFFKNVAVVIFENDSEDGSREAFKHWASIAKGYKVDLMSCGDDNPDCKFGISHRYDATEAKDYFASSAIGKMADFRQRLSDYVLETYPSYSHMIVVDLDLKVSLSPLGILHSLGTAPDKAVSSSGRQVWPGSLGTLVPPYDFSAFRPIETQDNKHLLNVHQWFCELLPEGDRWRNQCDAASSVHFLFVLSHDWLLTQEPYPVASAFNGATMYPLKLVKESGAKYDVGSDGQRCEHIGYNLAMPNVVNPKWNFHVMPTNPGGPTGVRSLKNILRIALMPRLGLVIFFQLMVFLVTFVACVMAIALVVTEASVGWIKAVRNDSMKLKELELPLTYSDFPVDTKDDLALSKRHVNGTSKRLSPKH